MSFKWSDSHMSKFLQSYRKNEVLWNSQHADYNKPNSRERSYLSMTRDMHVLGVTVSDIKAKIKTVRTRYASELTKVISSECEASMEEFDGIFGMTGQKAEVYKPRLFWFKEADAFLRAVYTPKGINNKPRALEYWDEDYEKLEASSLDFGAKRSADDGDDPELNQRGKRPKLYSRSREDFHEFDVFCHSLAIQLKRMPLERALLCQQKLQHVMTEERLEQLASCRETEESESASPAEPRESSAEFEERPTTTGFDVKQEKLDDV